jgi:hypothetical protein
LILAAALLLASTHLEARADQTPLMTRPLPIATAQAPQQCCRMCQKGQPCGDGCISANRQCTKAPCCACSATSGSWQPPVASASLQEHHENTTPVDRSSFRDQLASSIGFAISRNRHLLRRLLSEHVTDATREQLARRVVEHLELSGFDIDEDQQLMRRRPPTHGHG